MTQQEIGLAQDIETLAERITRLCDEVNRLRAVNAELLAALTAIVADYDRDRPLTADDVAIGRDIALARIALCHAGH